MEFHHLGSHCSFPACKQLDFLPFKCDACDGTFCLDHRTYEAHRCIIADTADRRALVCPICNTPIVPLPSQNPNIVLDDHINQGCAPKASTGYKCNMKGCKKVDVMAIVCKSCRRHHCVRHRFEDAHNCTRAKPKQPSPKITTPAPKTSHNNNNNPQPKLQPINSNPANLQNNQNRNNNNNNNYPGSYGSNHTYNPPPSNPRHSSPPTTHSNETTVGVRLTNGELLRRTCISTTTLREIQLFIDQMRTDGAAPYVMRTTYPPRELSYSDLDKTLAQLGLVPSGMIILQPLQLEEHQSNNNTTTAPPSNNSTSHNNSWWGLASSFFGSFLPSSSQ